MTEHQDPRFERALARAASERPWRCLSELLFDDGVRGALRAELDETSSAPSAAVTRRGFLKLLSASAALATMGAGCRGERVYVPYVTQPDDVVPGVPGRYATALSLGGYATGLVVESREGRPVKVEGNPAHPASLGASGVFEQASVLGLYDPSRARAVIEGNEPSTWEGFVERVLAPARARGGDGLCLLLEPTSSPLVLGLLDRVQRELPRARAFFHSPLSRGNLATASEHAFGRPLAPHLELRRATRVLALDADFLAEGPFSLRYARHFAERRRPVPGAEGEASRLYVVEATYSVTGAMADGRLALQRALVGEVARKILQEVARHSGPTRVALPDAITRLLDGEPERPHDAWARAVAQDLVAHAGASAVIVGESQPVEVHLLGILLNHALGNVGHSVSYREPFVRGEAGDDLGALARALEQGEVDTLLILEGNPAYTAPPSLRLGELLHRARTSALLALHENESAQMCRWFLPALHPLETWGDGRAYDGTVTFTQPLVRPLYGGKAVSEVLAALLADDEPDARTLLKERWRGAETAESFEAWWTRALARGFIENSAKEEQTPLALDFESCARVLARAEQERAPTGRGLELGFYPDARVYDGRFTNNAWLLELPEPMTKLTWDNAAWMSPRTAARLGLVDEQVVRLRLEDKSVLTPVLIVPGHADDAVSVHFGFGRSGSEALAAGVGFNAYALLPRPHAAFAPGLIVEPLPARHPLALTQEHWSLHERPIVETTTVSALAHKQNGDHASRRKRPLSLYHVVPEAEQQWGMAIDLNVCTGCSSCVIACQAENNVPVVGKEGVLLSREMHWLRIDRYFTGSPAAPDVVMQPMLCQHCERAPCEYVCPVNATVHSADGLNEMVYNRCVGTRFCSNNCPYKVRRFNYFDYNRDLPETVRMVKNPEVTVRARGVMEKCTFCVQRIREGQRQARLSGRRLQPDEVRTACQQACPTEAIAFGLVSRPESRVSRLHDDARSYAALDELGTIPRVRYLAKVRNPNRDLGGT